MKKISGVFFVFLILTSVIYTSCQKDDITSPSASCDQVCQDKNTAYGLAHIYNFIWNQHFAGYPSGNQDMTVNGPKGGSIHITGTTSVANNGINTVNLVFVMTNCKGLDDNYSLTFNGTMNVDGTFSSSYKAMGYTATQLSYQGTVGKNVNAKVNGVCDFSVNETQANISGMICGREFSYK